MREELELIELCSGADKRVENLQARTEEQINMGDCCGCLLQATCSKEEEVYEAFCEQLEVVSEPQALFPLGDFNFPHICWRDSTARHTKSRKLPQTSDDNFLTQVVKEPTRKSVLLDFVLINHKGLVEDMKIGGSLRCSDHEMVELRTFSFPIIVKRDIENVQDNVVMKRIKILWGKTVQVFVICFDLTIYIFSCHFHYLFQLDVSQLISVLYRIC